MGGEKRNWTTVHGERNFSFHIHKEHRLKSTKFCPFIWVIKIITNTARPTCLKTPEAAGTPPPPPPPLNACHPPCLNFITYSRACLAPFPLLLCSWYEIHRWPYIKTVLVFPSLICSLCSSQSLSHVLLYLPLGGLWESVCHLLDPYVLCG